MKKLIGSLAIGSALYLGKDYVKEFAEKGSALISNAAKSMLIQSQTIDPYMQKMEPLYAQLEIDTIKNVLLIVGIPLLAGIVGYLAEKYLTK
jgi:hypothetical protein